MRLIWLALVIQIAVQADFTCLVQDTRASDGRTNALRYLAKRLVTDEPPQAVLSTEVPHVMSAPLKMSLLVGCPGS